MFLCFAPTRGWRNAKPQNVAFQPIAERRDLVVLRKMYPGASFRIVKEADVFEPLLHQRVGPGGKEDGFSRAEHSDRCTRFWQEREDDE